MYANRIEYIYKYRIYLYKLLQVIINMNTENLERQTEENT